MTALSISALAKSFRAGTPGCCAAVRVLRDVRLTADRGEVIAIAGETRSGKTTLLHCAAGLLRPDAGTVRWFGDWTPRDSVAYLHPYEINSRFPSADRMVCRGALYARLEGAIAHDCTVLLVDDLALVSALERRLVIALIQSAVAHGACALLAADVALASDRCVTRTLVLAHGTLAQRKNLSAARMSASSFASRPRASASSTNGLSFRSPQ